MKAEFDESDVVCLYDETGYRLGEMLFDAVGDVGEEWEMTWEQETELSEILAREVINYIEENHLQPNCFKVIDIEEVGEQK